MFADCYKGKRIFLTGHTGFKGSWLSAWLTSLGATVCGYADTVPTTPAHFMAMGLGGHVRDLRGDIRDRDAVVRAMREFRPDAVFHLAAQALVRRSYDMPAATFESNVMGTLNVLEAMRACPSVQAGVFITSDKCYRNDEWVWGYRAGNVVGGGDWALDRIVPDCARAWAAGEAVRIRSPWATRPWQLVLEPLSGYLWLGAYLLGARRGPFPVRGEAYNFGPAADVNNTVAEVVEALTAYWPGFQSEMDKSGHAGMKECTLLKLCCDKALAHLGWKATLSFAETIRYTAEWYREFYAVGTSPAAVLALTLSQIADYTATARDRGLAWAV